MVQRWSGRAYICLFIFFLLFDRTTEQQLFLSWNERLALLRLRSSLGLRTRDWPIKANPCASWTGVRCNNGTVTGINISGLRRTRIAARNPAFSVESLANLSHLSFFNASSFQLPGSIPEWFGLKLSSLRILDLSSCSISGTIPSSLSKLVELSVLDLSRNSLTGSIPPGIGTLPRLRSLNLSHNSLSSSIPGELGGLSSLIDMDVGFNRLSGTVPQDLMGLRKLQVLVLSHNEFNGSLPDSLLLLPELQLLDVSVNNFTGVLPNVSLVVNGMAGVANLSRNLFYGNLANVFIRFRFVDVSYNYFQGSVAGAVSRNASLITNCLRNSTSQRSLQECVSFYFEKNLMFDNFGVPSASPPSRSSKLNRKNSAIIIVAAVFAGVVLIVIIIAVLLVCKHKSRRPRQRDVSVGPVPEGESPAYEVSFSLSNLGYAFRYQQILQATNELSDRNRIKHGHSGEFFQGVLEDETSVVIKKANLSSASDEDSCLSELIVFSKLSHPRFVPLLGLCLEKEDKFLVYKQLPEGDLATSLFKKQTDDSSPSLDWITRLKIATGVAEGLCYLHHECDPPLVHRDIQASSILLDDNFEVRLGSLSKACETFPTGITRLASLHKMSAQGSSSTLNATPAYDVYCFGIVLMELVTGKMGINSSTDATKKGWLESLLPYISADEKEPVKNIIDPSLILGEDLMEEVWAVAILARFCLNPRPLERPSMCDVLKALEHPQGFLAEDGCSGFTRLMRPSWGHSWRQSSMDARSGQRVEDSSNSNEVKDEGSKRIPYPRSLDEGDVEKGTESGLVKEEC